MENPGIMRIVQRARDTAEDRERLVEEECPLVSGQVLAKSDAFDVLHHEIRASPRIDTEVRHLDDIGMIEPAQGLCFNSEPSQVLRSVGFVAVGRV